MAVNYFMVRVRVLHSAFIAYWNTVTQEKPTPGNLDSRPFGCNKRNVNSGSAKKQKYVRHDTLKVKVFAYQNPEILNPVDITATWYQDGKIVETGHYYVIVLTGGYRVKYRVQVYTFKGIPNNDRKLQQLFDYIRRNPKRDYAGWLHHANVYWQVTKLFRDQIRLNYFL